MSQEGELNPRPLPYQGSALPLSYLGFIYSQLNVIGWFATGAENFEPRTQDIRAGDEARTRDLQLGRLSLYQLSYSRLSNSRIYIHNFKCRIFNLELKLWGEQDSNLRSHKTTDLQSVPVGRFGIPPTNQYYIELSLSKCAHKWRCFFKGSAKLYAFFFYSNF